MVTTFAEVPVGVEAEAVCGAITHAAEPRSQAHHQKGEPLAPLSNQGFPSPQAS